jgi:hypothetical protein
LTIEFKRKSRIKESLSGRNIGRKIEQIVFPEPLFRVYILYLKAQRDITPFEATHIMSLKGQGF